MNTSEKLPIDCSPTKTLVNIIYGLLAASLCTGITALVAVVIIYVKRNDPLDALAANHMRWQLRTFWFGLFWTILGAATFWLVIGVLILAVNYVWMVYRIVKGFIYLNDNKYL